MKRNTEVLAIEYMEFMIYLFNYENTTMSCLSRSKTKKQLSQESTFSLILLYHISKRYMDGIYKFQ